MKLTIIDMIGISLFMIGVIIISPFILVHSLYEIYKTSKKFKKTDDGWIYYKEENK